MPTNLFRRKASEVPNAKAAPKKKPAPPPGERVIRFRVGPEIIIKARLYNTPTAERLWMTLPFLAATEPWGDSIHFETYVETGRERGAVINGRPGEIYFWAEDDRIIIPFGPTPISRPGEMRLPRPCNPIAMSLDDLNVLKRARPGEMVTVESATD